MILELVTLKRLKVTGWNTFLSNKPISTLEVLPSQMEEVKLKQTLSSNNTKLMKQVNL